MNIFRISLIFTIIVAFIVTGIAVFLLLVPLDFSVSVNGRIVPRKVLEVTLLQDGRVLYIHDTGPVKKGDLLVAIDTEKETRLLSILTEERNLLQKEFEYEKRKIKAESVRLGWEIRLCQMILNDIEEQLKIMNAELHSHELLLARNNEKEKIRNEYFKRETARMISLLHKQHLCTKKEFMDAEYEKEMAILDNEEAKLQTKSRKLQQKLTVIDLNAELERKKGELAFLKELPENTRSLFNLRQQILKLQTRKMELDFAIKRKKIFAPFDGEILNRQTQKNEYLKTGTPVLELADISGLQFNAVAEQNVLSDVEKGQKVKIYLDNYPYLTYGYISGKLENIQTYLDGPESKFVITVSLRKPDFKIVSGLSGRADITVFHGTTIQYLLETKKIKTESQLQPVRE